MTRATKAREELAVPSLITHKVAAKQCGISTETLRDWIKIGRWPLPHDEINRTLLYRADWVRQYILTATWPKEARFWNEGGRREVP
jgi:hypothetical protein